MAALVGERVEIQWRSTVSNTSTDVGVEVRLPDGRLLTPAPSATVSTQTVSATFEPDMAGRYRLLWSRDGELHADVLDVWPSDPRLLISRADALAALRITGPTGVDPAIAAGIDLYIAAATPVLEDICGPLIATQMIRRFDGQVGSNLVLPHINVLVLDVRVSGVSLWPDHDYVVDQVAGIVHGSFPQGVQNVEVTYTVGSDSISPNVYLAARELVRFLYQIGLQGQRPTGPGVEASSFTPSGFAVPKRVIELCQASMRRAPGFA